MAENHSLDQSTETVLSEQDQADVLLDGLKNVFYNRLVVYFAVMEIALIASGIALDFTAGAYSETTNAAHVMAGIFGVFAVVIAAFFFLFLCVGVFFSFARAFLIDV